MSLDDDGIPLLEQQANVLIAMGRPGKAIPLLHKALLLSPNDTNLLAQLARAYVSDEQLEEGLRFAEQSIKAEPDYWWPHYLRSWALLNLAARVAPEWKPSASKLDLARPKRVAAVKASAEAVRLAPTNEYALYSLSLAQCHLGILDAARRTANTLLNLNPDSLVPYELLGLIALKEERWEEADGHNRRVLKLDPGSFQAMTNLGMALQGQKRYQEALTLFFSAATLNPASVIARENMTIAVKDYLTLALIAGAPADRQPSMKRRIARLPRGLRDYIRHEGNWRPKSKRAAESCAKSLPGIIAVGFTAAVVWSVIWLRDPDFRRDGTVGWVVFLALWIVPIICSIALNGAGKGKR